jgi:hypothetical protein
MVLESSVEMLDSELVLPVREETPTTDRTSILKLDTEDVHVETTTSSNAESMVDQTTMTRVLTHGSDVQENHGRDNHSEELVKNSLCLDQAQVGSGERQVMENGDH